MGKGSEGTEPKGDKVARYGMWPWARSLRQVEVGGLEGLDHLEPVSGGSGTRPGRRAVVGFEGTVVSSAEVPRRQGPCCPPSQARSGP